LGTAGSVLRHFREGNFNLLYSEPILSEILDVFNRPQIKDKYGLAASDIETILGFILLRGEAVVLRRRITLCRDPKDNMILETAADGKADAIVSGDKDLLSVEAFEGIPVLTPIDFVAKLG
jgi:putative PIN family toxin of toxin-antitoxin system